MTKGIRSANSSATQLHKNNNNNKNVANPQKATFYHSRSTLWSRPQPCLVLHKEMQHSGQCLSQQTHRAIQMQTASGWCRLLGLNRWSLTPLLSQQPQRGTSWVECSFPCPRGRAYIHIHACVGGYAPSHCDKSEQHDLISHTWHHIISAFALHPTSVSTTHHVLAYSSSVSAFICSLENSFTTS